jgi:hypothetical protein
MSSNLILCRFEPNRFPSSEFMKNQQGNLVFPYIHIARQPIHFANGQLVPPNYNPGSPGNPSPGGPPYPPTAVPPSYIPILPAMVEPFNRELEKYLQDQDHVELEDLLDFGKSFGLEIKDFNLSSMMDLNLGSIPKEILDNPEKLLEHFHEEQPRKFDLGRFGIDDSKFGSGRGGFGGSSGSGGLGGFGSGGEVD